MRTSRISKDTAKLLKRAARSPSPPRRTTRSSLARFALNAASSSATTTTTTVNGAGPQMPDIEDSVSPPPRKRRRGSDASFSADLVKAELDDDDDDEEVDKLDAMAAAPSRSSTRRARKPARKVADPKTGEPSVSPPSDWEEMYDVVRKMRAPGGVAYGAAVDTMGCERLADPNASPKDQRLHSLIALMLSSQTKDTVTAVVMRRLQTELPACKPEAPVGLNLDNLLAVDANLLNQMIWAVGFHNNKTKYIKKAAEILRDEWNGDIPDTVEGLTSLPGVGPKMAYLCLSVAWNRTEGIGVDVHVHRITNMWGWHKTKNPEETRLALQSWLPRDRWREINGLLVGLGQSVCLPVGRRCGECDLGLQGLCKAAERKKVIEGRRVKTEVVKQEVIKGEDGAEDKTTIKAIKEETVKVEREDLPGVGGGSTAVKVEAIVKEEVKVKQEQDD
ncbi:endonuclease III-like excision repair N-glycosylase involved in the repair of DNA base damage [Trichoderma parareesei]|uniref:Endonuclease III homolog n=1 Tax=Trichoderma parareesei TaxID=858221 RepID=A0A2H3AC25_TRIPA|nr:endonuclease III-like excision repair N-glycosylase involved in the repair of DNA base damage [Trichoderma parareesei]